MIKPGRRILALTAVLMALPGAAADRNILTIRGDGVVAMQVNGVDGRIRVDPSAVPRMLCNPDFAVRARMVAQGRAVILTDPSDAYGSFGEVTLRLAGRTLQPRANWLERRYVEGADCVIAPEMIGVDAAHFELRSSVRGERTVVMPLNPGGETSPDWNGAAATAVRLGDRDVSVGFTLAQPANTVTAQTALRIASAYGGRYAGEAVRTEAASGQERLLRRMVLTRPMAVGPVAIDDMQVRVTDWGSARRIKKVGDVDEPVDPNDVQVVARAVHEDTFERLMIGTDALKRCSSIVVDLRAKEMRLTCA
ncbi:hypothetical protein ACFSC3_08480 [Sphingomonas floccifaciens]|uniref:Uncharacterized protein n=1 Tax=Sphingomonas floccifaciens TaxID=1844115 RepID=A0ABW4NBV6_9SPHN